MCAGAGTENWKMDNICARVLMQIILFCLSGKEDENVVFELQNLLEHTAKMQDFCLFGDVGFTYGAYLIQTMRN